MSRTRKVTWIVAFIMSCFAGLLFNKNVSAAVSGETIIKKWEFTQYYNCSMNYAEPYVTQLRSGNVINSVFSANGSEQLYLPSYNYYNTVSSVNCNRLFNGASGLNSSIASYGGIGTVNWSSMSASRELMEKLGYKQEETNDFKFRLTGYKTVTTETCDLYSTAADRCKTSNPKQEEVTSDLVTVTRQVDGTMQPQVHESLLFKEFKFKVSRDSSYNYYMSIEPTADFWTCSTTSSPSGDGALKFAVGDNIEQFYQNVNSALANATWVIRCDKSSNSNNARTTVFETRVYSFKLNSDGTGIADSGENGKYVFPTGSQKYNATNSAISAMSGMNITGLILSNSELYTLYLHYLNSALPAGTANRLTCTHPESMNGIKMIRLKDSDGHFSICYINVGSTDLSKKVYTQAHTDLRGRQAYPYITTITLQGVIDWFNSVDTSTLDDVVPLSSMNITDETIDLSGGNTGTTCRGAAKSMGWLLCTILDGIGNGVSELYTNYVEPNLMLEPTLFVENGRNGTKQGWDVFRNIANVAIIILFLVVIFSQLTGVGIDNYGIKKILPKLILVAVLMNLSYYICVALVDISNIAGSGVQGVFNNLPPGVNQIPSEYGVGSAVTDVISTALLSTAVAGAVWGFSLATLIALIPTAISVLVSIFFLFILLAAREAAVVVLVVLAPLAFACFILPNTKKIFDRWVKVGEALLLVYPIAGLLVAGGNYVSRILLAAGVGGRGIASAITAMLVGIVPIFFIPSVLRSSMSGLGNIGNRISNLGSRLGRGAGSAVGNSELFKMQQQRANEARARKLAGLKKDKDGNWTDSARGKFAKSGFGRALGLKRMQDRYRGQANSMETARRTEEQMGELGVLNAQRTKDDNILKDRAAEAQVGVPVLTEELAVQRAEARRNAQELKAFQDQLANFSNGQLLETAGLAGNNPKNNPFGANGWLRQAGGAQKMAALMGAMINNGMENDIYKLLENDVDGEIGNNSSVMQMLAGVKEKGLKAYGKKGKGRSYVSFMEDEVDVLDGDGNPTGRRATLMQQYIDDKGSEFNNDLSDKTMKQILKHGGMTNGQVIDVVSKAKSQDLINVGDQILQQRMAAAAESGEQIKITGNQLASLSPTTISTLNSTEVGRQAILEASQDLIRNNRLQTGIDSNSRTIIDNIRESAGQSAIWTVSEKRTQNAPTVEATELDVSAERVQQAQQAVPSGGPEITVNAGGGVSGFEAAYNARTASTQQPVVQQQATVEPVVQQTAQPVVQATAEQVVVDTSSAGPMPTVSTDFGPVPVQYQSTGINELFNDATRKSGADLDGVNSAIMNYQGSDFKVTGDQLVGLKLSTVTALTTSDNPTHRQAMLTASDEVANNPALKARLGGPVLARINAFRVSNGRPTL